ncbi:hypothetical protein, partial [Hymenobacter terrenus]
MLTFPPAGTLSPQVARSYGFTLVAPGTTPVILVSAAATTSTSDPSLSDNMAMTTTNVRPATDVSIALTGPPSVVAGQLATYNVTTTNNGSSPATQVQQTVTIPAGLLTSTSNATSVRLNGALPTSVNPATGVATFSNGTTYDPTSGVVSLPTLATLNGGQLVQNAITYQAPGTGPLANVAAITISTPANSSPNNTSTVTTAVTAAADVVVALSGPATAASGTPVSYAVTTTNTGRSPIPATAPTTVTAQLPVNLPVALTGPTLRVNGSAPTAVNATTGVATYADNTTYDPRTGVVSFPPLAGQVPGAAGSVTATLSFEAPDTEQLTLGATATPAAAANDLNRDNNSAVLTTTLDPPTTPSADLAVTVTSSVSSQAAGAPITFTVTPSNTSTSPGPATNVQTQVTVAAGLLTSGPNAVAVNGQTTPTAVNATTGLVTYADGATYDPTSGLVSFPAIATLAVNTLGTAFTVKVPAPGAGPALALGGVRSNNYDPV